MAAPHVAGAAALFNVEHPEASPQEIMNMVLGSSSKPDTTCDESPQGYFSGDIDALNEPLLFREPPTFGGTSATPIPVSDSINSNSSRLGIRMNYHGSFRRLIMMSTKNRLAREALLAIENPSLIATVFLNITLTIHWLFQAKFTDNCATTSTGISSYNAAPMFTVIHINYNDLGYKNNDQ
jgi:hypothetical protein